MLYRLGKSSKIQTLFFIGNGAIKDGDVPLQNALAVAQTVGFFKFEAKEIGDIAALSCLHLQEEQLFELLMLYLKGVQSTLPSHDEHQTGFQLLIQQLYARAVHFRLGLSSEYLKYQNKLCFRGSYLPHLVQLGLYDEASVCVTTNWDETIWNDKKIINVLHLHGRSSIPSSLILPTETMSARALKSQLFREEKALLLEQAEAEDVVHLVEEIIEHYRVESGQLMNTQLFEIENIINRASSSVEKVVIAGMRFNEYDHELMTVFERSGLQKNCEIIVVNRAKDEADKDNKIKKIAGLFSCPTSMVKFLKAE